MLCSHVLFQERWSRFVQRLPSSRLATTRHGSIPQTWPCIPHLRCNTSSVCLHQLRALLNVVLAQSSQNIQSAYENAVQSLLLQKVIITSALSTGFHQAWTL